MNGAAELLEAARQGDRDACEEMIRENAGLIWSIVRRYYGRGAEPEDLYQLGCMGFLKALRGFDQDYGTQFSTYAVPKIAGEIRRFLRDNGPVKVGRGLREQAMQILSARERLAHGDRVAVHIKSVLPERMKIKLSVVDPLPPLPRPEPIRYFVTGGHLDRWQYAPEGCLRRGAVTEFGGGGLTGAASAPPRP